MHSCRLACKQKQILSQVSFSLSLCSGYTSCWVISMQVGTLRGDKIRWNENCSELVRKWSTLQGAAAALPWQRWGEHALESESQGYSISSCFNNISPYERNITSLASMMKIHIRSFQPVYLSNEHGEPAIKFKTRKWTAHILVSLTNKLMRPDFRLLHTISGLAYLNGTRLVKTTDVFPPWNRHNWEEKKEVDFIACETTRNTNEESLRRMQTGMETLFNTTVQQLSMVRVRPIFFPGVCVRGEAAGERLALYWSLWGRGQGSLLGFEFSTWSISGHTCGLLKPMTVELTNAILLMKLMREEQMYAAPLEIFCVQVHNVSDTINFVYM